MLDQLLRDMAGAAQDAARQPEFAVVRRRGRRLRLRRRVGTAAVALLAVSGLASVASLGTGNATPDSIATSPSPAWTPPADKREIETLGSVDGEHIYVSVLDCRRQVNAARAAATTSAAIFMKCEMEFVATDDGGKTWRSLDGVGYGGDITVVGPEALLAWWPDLPNPYAATNGNAVQKFIWGDGTYMVSLDGGRNWKDVTVDDDSAAKVSAGMRAVDCDSFPDKQPCTIYAVDPATGTLRPTHSQPSLERVDLIETPAAAGIWVRGVDPVTGRPATAVSHDGGTTWKIGDFDAEPAMNGAGTLYVETTNGVLAFAMVIDNGSVRVYRTTDGGDTWTRTNDATEMPAALSNPYSFVTTDGTHVVRANDNGSPQYLASPDGRRYTPLNIPGLPAGLGNSPRAVTATRFLFNGGDAIHTSPDGRVWTRHPLP